MATKVFCDRCGVELNDSNRRRATVTIELAISAKGSITVNPQTKQLDLCLRHTEELRRWTTEQEPQDAKAP